MFFFFLWRRLGQRGQKGYKSISFDYLITHSCPLKHFRIWKSFQYFNVFIYSQTCICLETINIVFHSFCVKNALVILSPLCLRFPVLKQN